MLDVLGSTEYKYIAMVVPKRTEKKDDMSEAGNDQGS